MFDFNEMFGKARAVAVASAVGARAGYDVLKPAVKAAVVEAKAAYHFTYPIEALKYVKDETLANIITSDRADITPHFRSCARQEQLRRAQAANAVAA